MCRGNRVMKLIRIHLAIKLYRNGKLNRYLGVSGVCVEGVDIRKMR